VDGSSSNRHDNDEKQSIRSILEAIAVQLTEGKTGFTSFGVLIEGLNTFKISQFVQNAEYYESLFSVSSIMK